VTGAAILAGYGADLVLGDPRRGHPVALFGRAALALERTLYRPSRVAGTVHTGLLVGGAAALARILEGGRARSPATGGWPVRRGRLRRSSLLAISLWAGLGGRSLVREARRVGSLVDSGDLPAARRAVTALVGRDPSQLGEEELCRAAVESVAENTVDAVVAPLVWAVAAGPGGVLAHRAVNTLDAMVGHRSERYERFGWAAARLDDLANWPAARLAAAATVALAPVAAGSSRDAWRVLRRDGSAHPSPNGGRAEAAFAGALGLRLGGCNVYASRVEERPGLGDGRAPTPADVERAARLSLAVGATAALAAAALRGRA
jgi:adenosylcobinamide-phosphate synthase